MNSIENSRQLLQQIYGFDGFRPGQEEIIRSALEGRDSLVIMPTGSGKSLCYQIPALVKQGVCVVVSPLIALMQDQVSALSQLGVSAAFLNSTLAPRFQREVLDDLSSGRLDLLYIAPERLMEPATFQQFQKLEISMFAIDEAHCVSQWGHDFRKEYFELKALSEYFPNVPRMALTATATERTRNEIIDRLELRNVAKFVHGFDRPNIRYSVEVKGSGNAQLIDFLNAHRGESGIVYCLSRRGAQDIAQILCDLGYDALAYHAGMDSNARAENQARFLRDDGVVMVATIAFGMGIDKPDVRFIAHVNLPQSIEGYYQETGRAGRDGDPAEAFMTYGLQDIYLRLSMVEQSDGDELHRKIQKDKIYSLLAWCELATCRREGLLNYFGDNSVSECGNCDNCLAPPRTRNATEDARKLLSCVYRVGERFGVTHIIDVLCGHNTAKVNQHGHQDLSTFGIGEDLKVDEWRSVARQLLVRGFMKTDFENYQVIKLTPEAWPVLRGEVPLQLRFDSKRKHKRERAAVKSADVVPMTPGHELLWEALRYCRLSLAQDAGVPAYVICHDRTLREVMQFRPRTHSQMRNLHGMGERKVSLYADAFIKVIDDHESSSFGNSSDGGQSGI